MAEVFARPNDAHVAGKGHGALQMMAVKKVYGGRENMTAALNGVSFNVENGEFVAIMGPSGSGKTTLLNCISTIDRVTSGSIVVGGRNITSLSRGELTKFRRNDLGFIFQDFNLLDTLTGFENIALALTIKGAPARQIPEKVRSIARTLGVDGVLDKYPYQMSGGQKQRVAAARAMVGDPRLILADEPTGALDSLSSAVMLEIMELMNRDLGATIIMVTHDSFAASFSDRVLFLRDGALFNELRRGDSSREEFFTRIMEVTTFLSGEVGHGI